MGLKKLFKKARKSLGLPALTLGNAAKVGAAVATGGIGAAGVALGGAVIRSKLKSAAAAGVKQVLRTKSQKAQAKKAAQLAPPNIVDIRAQTMPGGAPLRGVRSAAPKRRKAAASAKPKRAPKAKKAPTGSKRTPPKGGLNLKALSASWKAAGKPGSWQAWIKANK